MIFILFEKPNNVVCTTASTIITTTVGLSTTIVTTTASAIINGLNDPSINFKRLYCKIKLNVL